VEPSAPQICTSFLFLKQPIHFSLFVIPDIFHRESILLFPGHLLVVGTWNRLHLFSQRQRPSAYLLLPGFARAAELVAWRVLKGATFVDSAKGPKTMLAVVWPFGPPARFADSGGAQTPFAQTMRALFPVPAALLGQTTRPVGVGELGSD
jgi:hypothetical protein